MGEEKKTATSPCLWRAMGLLALVVAIGLGIFRWCTLQEPKYFWPQSAEDWAAWGAVVGSGGTIGAVIYAARTFKKSADVQRNEQRDRHLEMDYLEGMDAKEATKLKLLVTGRLADGEDRKPESLLSGARIELRNYSGKKFRDLQVVIPNETLGMGNSLCNVEFQKGIFFGADKVPRAINNLVEEEKITWQDFLPKFPRNAEMTLFPLSDLPAGEALVIRFDFDDPTLEHNDKWSYPPDPWSEEQQRDILVSVSYVDEKGMHWMRSTMDDGNARRLRYPKFEKTLSQSLEDTGRR